MKTFTTFGALAVAGLAGAASADIITSTFDSGNEGWALTDSISLEDQSTSGDPEFREIGGNQGGLITAPIDWNNDAAFFVAPGAFLGDQSDKASVRLDRRFVEPHESINPFQFDYDTDVVLRGTSFSIAIDLAPVSMTEWESFEVALSEAGGWFILDSGDQATDAQIGEVLSELTDIRVRGNLSDGAGNIGFDNFALVPTSGSATIMAIAGLCAVRRGRR